MSKVMLINPPVISTKENIKFCINPSGSVGIKVPDVGDFDFGKEDFTISVKVDKCVAPKHHYHGWEGKDYFGIEEAENGFVVRLGRKTFIVDSQDEGFLIRDKFRAGGLSAVNEYLKAKKPPNKEVHTVLYVIEKDGTPLRLVGFNRALTIGEVNELVKQASGDRAFTLGGDKDKPFCDLL